MKSLCGGISHGMLAALARRILCWVRDMIIFTSTAASTLAVPNMRSSEKATSFCPFRGGDVAFSLEGFLFSPDEGCLFGLEGCSFSGEGCLFSGEGESISSVGEFISSVGEFISPSKSLPSFLGVDPFFAAFSSLCGHKDAGLLFHFRKDAGAARSSPTLQSFP
eukprot:CAMPEP_0198215102 /NCGR_PEP_ID=MMETSP1445-20131203/47106_1 /TAXON_ID=36898 /ORGANISM="Pyramimonas sp., Strain CCMP2087" /LENGTH=163 /DNA_ID=CAMNT_0043890655 /DNA_START=34 /DNA_END=525 /DNA_ORIENTATION=+